MAASTTGDGVGLPVWGGILAVCLAADTILDCPGQAQELQRLETWIEELVRRSGTVQNAVEAIAQGRESFELALAANAKSLLAIWNTSSDKLEALAADNASVQHVLDVVSKRLATMDSSTREALTRQLNSLDRIELGLTELSKGQLQADYKLDAILAHASRLPTEHDLSSIVDAQDSCRLRTEALQKRLDESDFSDTTEFADRCLAWVEHLSSVVPATPRILLLERLSEEGVFRLRQLSEDRRGPALARLVRIANLMKPLIPFLDDAGRLRVSSRVAYLESWIDSPDSGLAQLVERNDPFALKYRLAILLNAKKFAEASELVQGSEPVPEWIQQALRAAAHLGNWVEADRLLEWALANAEVRLRNDCLIVYSELLVLLTDRSKPSSDPNSDDEMYPRLKRCWTLLQPLVTPLITVTTRTPADFEILSVSTEIARRLDMSTELQALANVLAQQNPLNSGLAELARVGRISLPRDWPRRLRAEGKQTPERLLLAVALECQLEGRVPAAFAAAKQLAPKLDNKEDRLVLHSVLMEMEHLLPPSERADWQELVATLVNENDRDAKIRSASQHIRAGNLDTAEPLIASLKDPSDANWLQLRGHWLLKKGNAAEAVKVLTEAALQMDLAGQLNEVGCLAIGQKQWPEAMKLFARLLVLRPKDRVVRVNAATAYFALQHFSEALPLLESLAEEYPSEPGYATNAAACLARLGRATEAINLLTNHVAAPEPAQLPVIALAQLLNGEGKRADAFNVLERLRDRFWNNYEFVGVYWTLAYAAEREDRGHQAFLQMRLLQAQGTAPSNILVETTLDQLLDQGKEHAEREKQRALTILRGQLPWLAIAEYRYEPAVRAWSQRTGRRRWLWEDPTNLADAAVYSSNAFTALSHTNDLVPLECPPSGTAVVADLSALITLDQLGLLAATLDFFGAIHIPHSYLFHLLIDGDRLQPHQPSRRTALSALAAAMASGHLAVTSPADDIVPKLLDEHHIDDQPTTSIYHLRDLADALSRAGAITEDQLKALLAISHRPALANAQHPAIEPKDWLQISISTLCSLHSVDLLQLVFDAFKVTLSDDDRATVNGEIHWFATQANLIEVNKRLAATLRDDPRIQRGTSPSPSDNAHKHVATIALDSVQLSAALNMPLLADDRVVQATCCRTRSTSATTSFGTAHVLRALAAHKAITFDQYGTALRKLMEWRYRFILIDPALLKHWALKSLSTIPGPDLMAVARYLHDCCRDPGLFGGLENSNPPTSMSMKFYMTSESAIGEFVGSLWTDVAVPEEKAAAVTAWATSVLLPSPPLSAEPLARALADARHSLFLTHFILTLIGGPDVERGRRGLKVVAEQIGLNAHSLNRVGTEIADALL